MSWKQIASYVNITIQILRIVKNVIKKVTQEFIDQKVIQEEIEQKSQEYPET